MNFPDDENGALLQEMADAGIDLSKTHEVDFFHLFEKQPQAQKMAEVMAKEHPNAVVKVVEDETPGVWDVNCTVKIVPSYGNICEAEKTFESIADKCNGYADGWGLMAEE
jgi:hypothetical protein